MHTATEVAAPGRMADSWRLILILGLLSALGPLSIDMYLPSFPELARSFDTSVASVQLTLATYLAGLAVGQLGYGPLSDRIGRRTPLLAGLALYAVASVVCATAPSLLVLAVGRFVQAIGGCAGMVIARAVVRDTCDEDDAARMFSSLMLVMGAAPILAPLLGSQVLAFAGWQAIFGVLAVVATLLGALVAFGLPETLPAAARSRLPIAQVTRTVGEVGRDVRFLRPALAGGAMQAAMFAYISGSPFVFIELLGVPADRFGFVFGANALGLIGASQLNRWIVPRFGVHRVLRLAVVAGAAMFGLLALAGFAGAGLGVLVPVLFLGMSSLGLVLPNATAAAMAPFGGRAGVASALLGTLQTACGAVAAVAVSALADGTARPMTAVMFACALLALLLLRGQPQAAASSS